MSAAASHPARKAIEHLLGGEPDTLKRVLAVIESAAPAGQDAGPIQLQLTPTIQRNYVQRDVFHHLRPERAPKVLPSLTALFFVTVEEAEAVLQDAQEQRRKSDGPRGQAKAFTGLIQALASDIKSEKFRDCIQFPGEEKVEAERLAASAILDVGDRVTVWFDGEKKGPQATVVSPYGPYRVADEDGPFIRDGKRIDYCQGYRAENDDGETFFYYAWQLAPIGESYGHLRLVR
jgi:hypothetical protein